MNAHAMMEALHEQHQQTAAAVNREQGREAAQAHRTATSCRLEMFGHTEAWYELTERGEVRDMLGNGGFGRIVRSLGDARRSIFDRRMDELP